MNTIRGADPLVRAGRPRPALRSWNRLPGPDKKPAGGPAADQGVRPTPHPYTISAIRDPTGDPDEEHRRCIRPRRTAGRRVAGPTALATDRDSDGQRRCRTLQDAAARIRRYPAVSRLERPGRQGPHGQNRPGSGPAFGRRSLRGEHVAGTRRAEIPLAGAHGPGEVRGPGSRQAGDETVDPGRMRLPQRVCRRQGQRGSPPTDHAGARRGHPHQRDARPDADHAHAARHLGRAGGVRLHRRGRDCAGRLQRNQVESPGAAARLHRLPETVGADPRPAHVS